MLNLKAKLSLSRKSPAAANTAELPAVPLERIYYRPPIRTPTKAAVAALKRTVEGELFKRFLTRFQWDELARTGFVPVRGSLGGIYYVPVLTGFTVVLGFTQRSAYSYCLAVDDSTPADAIIARILLLMADERLFLVTAFKNPW